jgi:hypothetical protein
LGTTSQQNTSETIEENSLDVEHHHPRTHDQQLSSDAANAAESSTQLPSDATKAAESSPQLSPDAAKAAESSTQLHYGSSYVTNTRTTQDTTGRNSGGGGLLFEGNYNENESRESFLQALYGWRQAHLKSPTDREAESEPTIQDSTTQMDGMLFTIF